MITPRLQCILKYANSDVIADIGTDHAYIPIEIIKGNRAKKVIAADINKGPLDIAKKNIDDNELSNKIETRLGEGISVLKKGEAGQIIIAGMGGELISNIINDNIETAYSARLLLQPMNEQELLRRFLINNGFTITSEDIAVEGFKIYNIINAEKGEQKPFEKEIDYHIPQYLKGHEFYRELYNKKKREFSKIVSGLEKAKSVDKEKLKKYRILLNELMERN